MQIKPLEKCLAFSKFSTNASHYDYCSWGGQANKPTVTAQHSGRRRGNQKQCLSYAEHQGLTWEEGVPGGIAKHESR